MRVIGEDQATPTTLVRLLANGCFRNVKELHLPIVKSLGPLNGSVSLTQAMQEVGALDVLEKLHMADFCGHVVEALASGVAPSLRKLYMDGMNGLTDDKLEALAAMVEARAQHAACSGLGNSKSATSTIVRTQPAVDCFVPCHRPLRTWTFSLGETTYCKPPFWQWAPLVSRRSIPSGYSLRKRWRPCPRWRSCNSLPSAGSHSQYSSARLLGVARIHSVSSPPKAPFIGVLHGG